MSLEEPSQIFIGPLPTNYYLFNAGKTLTLIYNGLTGHYDNVVRVRVDPNPDRLKKDVWQRILEIGGPPFGGPSPNRYPQDGTKTVEKLIRFKTFANEPIKRKIKEIQKDLKK